MELLALEREEIKPVFLDLWGFKECNFGYTAKDFSEWCDHMMPEDIIAYGIKDGEGCVGGFIAYPIPLPPCLFVILMITLKAGDRKLFRPLLNDMAKSFGFDHIRCSCPVEIAISMQRIFNMEEVERVYKWKTE